MNTIRVRFAPSPTGMMHLGNVRTALLNYLFAQQKHGTFILRLEDTDPERMFDPEGKKIMADLAWLGLSYEEGPDKGGPCAPYAQSERTALYQEHLKILEKTNHIYRCFCTEEVLEQKRQRQIALKQPPRYDRTCLKLSSGDIQERLSANTPFIWRFKVDHAQSITIHDLARGPVTFDMSNFSDFPLTRTNGTFTFLFSNCIDDILMRISHIFRGEDHLSNTANQAAIFLALNTALPIYWHMPMICNTEGKKLSKRDFGFSLQDLKDSGYLPEAICNYLAITGGSFAHEIMDMKELIKAFNFDSMHHTGNIRYDVEKLTWVNHAWIELYEPAELAKLVLPFLVKAYPGAEQLSTDMLIKLVQIAKSEMRTLADSVIALAFYFETPKITVSLIQEQIDAAFLPKIKAIIYAHMNKLNDFADFMNNVKQACKEQGIQLKLLFTFLRLLLTGSVHGPQLHDIVAIIGTEKTRSRLEQGL